jgi:hypothetical protein
MLGGLTAIAHIHRKSKIFTTRTSITKFHLRYIICPVKSGRNFPQHPENIKKRLGDRPSKPFLLD